MIFAAQQLQEKCREQHRDLYTVFIDLTKAFDMVSRSGLWLLLRKFGCTEKFTKILKSLHKDEHKACWVESILDGHIQNLSL